MVPLRFMAVVVLALLGGVQSGCQPSAGRRERLNSTYAPTRAQAVVQSAEAGDATAIHKLVDLLEDEDRGVRMYSILALRRLCGVDYGYRYFESEAQRLIAVERWRDAIRAGEVRLVQGGPEARRKEPGSLAADVGATDGSAVEDARGAERK